MKEIIMNFNTNGTVETLYNDELDLENIGILNIKRASHVEPTSDGAWIADMSPVNGPILGPFTKRNIALEEEVRWLNQNYFKFGEY